VSPLLKGFSDWLSATPLSASLQAVQWLVPTTQTVHILAIAAVMASASMINLRLAGIGGRSQALAKISARFLSWVWGALAVLAASGALLILIEPGRPLTNPVFYAKVSLISVVAVLTLFVGNTLRIDSQFWERSRARRLTGAGIAILSWTLWVGVICAGRWIAYTQSL
jgi:uncharacterized membrane protein